MRLFACGGAAVPHQVINSCYETLENCRAFRVYGSTETPVITQGFVGDGEQKLAAETDGQIYGYDVKIIDDDGNALPDGEDGEIVAKGPGMMLGYGDPSENAKACLWQVPQETVLFKDNFLS